MLYVEIVLQKETKEVLPQWSYDEVIDKILSQTTYYIGLDIPIYGIVLEKKLYDWLVYKMKETQKLFLSIKRDKIESIYGYKVAIKE